MPGVVLGLFASLMIPLGEASKSSSKTPSGLFLFYPNPSLKRAWLVIRVKQKTRSKLRVLDDDFGGERGIRTPGPTIAGQRFSRPPHSTALPFLPLSAVASAKAEFVRRSFSEGGIRSAAKIILFSFFRIFRKNIRINR